MRVERIAWDGARPPRERDLHERLVSDGFAPHSWSDRPGATYAPHAHEHDESLWVLDGEIDFFIAGETFHLGVGDRLQLPAGTVHGAKAGPGGASYLIGERRGEGDDEG